MTKYKDLYVEKSTGVERAKGHPDNVTIDTFLNENFHKHISSAIRNRDPVYALYSSVTYRETKDRMGKICVRITSTHQASYLILYRPRPGASQRTHRLADYRDISYEQAVELAKEARIAISEGRHPKDAHRQKKALEGPTLAECLEDKIRERGIRPDRTHGLAQSTVGNDRKNMRIAKKYGLADKKMTTITSYEVRKMHDQISLDIRNRGGKRGDGYSTAAKVVNLINAMYRFAEKNYETEDIPPEKIITHNPCDPLKATKIVGGDHKVRKASDRSIRQAELARFWSVLDSLKDYEPDRHNKQVESHIIGRAYLMFMLLTGMRGGALSHLKFRMYKQSEKCLYIVGDDKHLMKANNNFMLPLSDEAAKIIEDMRLRHGNYTDYIFPNVTGKKGAAIGVPAWVQLLRSRVQIDFTAHGLRSTYITCAESCKVPINVYKQLVDHGNQPQDVTSGYTRSEIETMRQYSQKITDFILFNAGVKKVKKEKYFTANDNPFNIKEKLHSDIEGLAEDQNKTVRDMYEQCLKLGFFAHKYPDMQAKQLLDMIAMI